MFFFDFAADGTPKNLGPVTQFSQDFEAILPRLLMIMPRFRSTYDISQREPEGQNYLLNEFQSYHQKFCYLSLTIFGMYKRHHRELVFLEISFQRDKK